MNCRTAGQKVYKKLPRTSIKKAESEVLLAAQWPLLQQVTSSSPYQASYRSMAAKNKDTSRRYMVWHCRGPKFLLSTETIWKHSLLFWKEETACLIVIFLCTICHCQRTIQNIIKFICSLSNPFFENLFFNANQHQWHVTKSFTRTGKWLLQKSHYITASLLYPLLAQIAGHFIQLLPLQTQDIKVFFHLSIEKTSNFHCCNSIVLSKAAHAFSYE